MKLMKKPKVALFMSFMRFIVNSLDLIIPLGAY
jgi:hypothetical protein